MNKWLILFPALLLLSVCSCSVQRRSAAIRRDSPEVSLQTADPVLPEVPFQEEWFRPDTLTVEDDGRRVTILKAVRSDDGSMSAVDVLEASYVTARFRNVAERDGKVDLRFRITVPASMTESRWQIRLSPVLAALGDTVRLDKVLITGQKYRKEQLKGYEQYRKFINSIVTDTLMLVDRHQLEVFIERNLPKLHAFRSDSSVVSREQFESAFGVTESEAVAHYLKKWLLRRNLRRDARRDEMFAKLVKAPLVSEGIRLDSIITDGNGITYEYVQALKTRPGLKRADIYLSGDVLEGGSSIYDIPEAGPITYYISTLGSLAENRTRYKTEIVRRKVSVQKNYAIAFRKGEYYVDKDYSSNGPEMERIMDDIRAAVTEDEFIIDSLIITSSCSPEGSYLVNSSLSRQRAAEVSRLISEGCSIMAGSGTGGFSVGEDGTVSARGGWDMEIVPRSIPEDWDALGILVKDSPSLTDEWKRMFSEAQSDTPDPDRREALLKADEEFYKVLSDSVYPLLRNVRIEFCLSRKGMVKDTVHTTVPDSDYAEGLLLLSRGEYAKAASTLRPYKDYNSALAHCAAGNDASAIDILSRLPENGKTCYLRSVLYSRKGDTQKAVEQFLKACALDKAFVHRGNLDPEISSLITTYNLSNELLQ